MKNKKLFMLCGLLLIAALAFSGCGGQSSEGKTSIVTTSFEEYDWVNEILGDNKENFEVTYLMESGVDVHSYEPTTEDVTKISSADLLIYNGGPSYEWVEEVIEQSENQDIIIINVMERLGDAVKMEVAVEGMQSEEHAHDEESHDHDDHESHEDEESHDHDDHESHEDEEEHAEGHEDEHVWLSLRNAVKICEIISTEISTLDPDNKNVYEENATAYIEKLNSLDAKYTEMVTNADRDTVIVTDRFPFLYLMSDYGIKYYAAFQGCSAETDASFETITFLADKSEELNANNLIIIENGLEDIAVAVSENSQNDDDDILTLNSIQSVSTKDIEEGATYLSIMEENLEILKEALTK